MRVGYIQSICICFTFMVYMCLTFVCRLESKYTHVYACVSALSRVFSQTPVTWRPGKTEDPQTRRPVILYYHFVYCYTNDNIPILVKFINYTAFITLVILIKSALCLEGAALEAHKALHIFVHICSAEKDLCIFSALRF